MAATSWNMKSFILGRISSSHISPHPLFCVLVLSVSFLLTLNRFTWSFFKTYMSQWLWAGVTFSDFVLFGDSEFHQQKKKKKVKLTSTRVTNSSVNLTSLACCPWKVENIECRLMNVISCSWHTAFSSLPLICDSEASKGFCVGELRL